MTYGTSASITVDFKAAFEAMPGNSVLVEANAPYYNVLAATEDYLQLTCRTKEELESKGLFESIPSNPNDPGTSG